ncbi:MAG: ADP-ribose pyrophosphatase [Myxococcota bacterium]|jgi:ADP-ribose pyrophosphatase
MSEPLTEVLAEGRFTRLVRKNGWEYVERTNTSGIVLVIALTPENELLLVEQFRPPVNARVIELPAGLAGDIVGQEDEALSIAAGRELEEETGFRAARLEEVARGPLSAGLTTEVVTVFRAYELTRVSDGGGDETEDIVVHAVPLADVPVWLATQTAAGVMLDPKVYAALYFLGANSQ